MQKISICAVGRFSLIFVPDCYKLERERICKDKKMGKIAIKKENKRKDLLNAAFGLFTTKGFHDTSIADIVSRAGIAKGTFYLYFKDKEDIRNCLITTKAAQLFQAAYDALMQTDLTNYPDKVIFLTDYLLDRLEEDPALLSFLAKQLSWGVFRHSVSEHAPDTDITTADIAMNLMTNSEYRYDNPEIILYLIIELVSGTSYNAILYQDPASLDELRPYLHTLIRQILEDFRKE